ncbi:MULTISPECIES: integrase family protein [unclassified Pseudovibrio]|uniref:tyrosine-type recombinase/integrase n=1 Tax=unclassified Pseudovibrio TaxID=2627060 RepID=UPI0007B25EA4|nr:MULTISPECIES: integrase family protein [unclassified Pseudovibrio]KZK93261.1 hypothetical protein PsW74_05417 [Pseudovibrio sp. W74]KZL07152.1 hypothetical protein PsAD14_04620 [Pseudovibrio sp. Ad14]
MPNITKRTVDAASPAHKKQFLWDSKLKGFGLQVMPSGAKTFIVQYRTHEGRSRRMSLGRYGELTPDQARDLATNVLATVHKGDDPLLKRENKRTAPTVNVLLDTYMSKHVQVHNKPKTMKDIERLLNRCVRSQLGYMKLNSVRRQDIAKLHHSLRATPRQANQVLAVLSKAFNLAEVWGLRPEHSNPVRLVKRYKENERDRFLSKEELRKLGRTLELAEHEGLPWIIKAGKDTAKHLPKDIAKRKTPINPRALYCLRLLLYTGARLSEITTLK